MNDDNQDKSILIHNLSIGTGSLLWENGNTTSQRVENNIPVAYRLKRTKSGDIILQGLFTWMQGWEGGAEWRDIPTVEEDVNDTVSGV